VLKSDGVECPRAVLDEHGILSNPDEAIGEIVNTAGIGKFEGYYKNDEATRDRTRGGMYWSGDFRLPRRCRLRLLHGPSARLDSRRRRELPRQADRGRARRHPMVYLAARLRVPDATTRRPRDGDARALRRVAVRRRELYEFLARQPDVSPKWWPTYVRIAREPPMTATNKILVRELRREKFRLDRVRDPLWWRERGDTAYKPFAPANYERVVEGISAAGREALLTL